MTASDRAPAPAALSLAAVGFAGFALLRFVQILPFLAIVPVGAWSFTGRLVQCVLAAFVAAGIWYRRPWAAPLTVALGVAVALTVLGEAFVEGIMAALPALAIAVLAIVGALVLARWMRARLGG